MKAKWVHPANAEGNKHHLYLYSPVRTTELIKGRSSTTEANHQLITARCIQEARTKG